MCQRCGCRERCLSVAPYYHQRNGALGSLGDPARKGQTSGERAESGPQAERGCVTASDDRKIRWQILSSPWGRHGAVVPSPCPSLSLKHRTEYKLSEKLREALSQHLDMPAPWTHPRCPLSISAPGTAPSSQGQLRNNLDIESAPRSLSGVMILGSHSCSGGFKAPAQWSEQQR